MSTAPKAFYRLQHRSSYTRYEKDGLYANARYNMHYHHWINQAKFNSHLNRKDRPLEPMPYISMFDNFGARQTASASQDRLLIVQTDAEKRVEVLWKIGCEDVFIARIQPRGLYKTSIPVAGVSLPVWRALDGTLSLATVDMGQHSHMRPGNCQLCE